MTTEELLNSYFLGNAIWKYRFAIFPHRCAISGKWLWLSKHYRLDATYHSFVHPFGKSKWLHRELGMQIKLMKQP